MVVFRKGHSLEDRGLHGIGEVVMVKHKGVTFQLTDKQQHQIEKVTAENYGEPKIEASPLVARRGSVAAKKKAALRPLRRTVAKRGVVSAKKKAALRPLRRSLAKRGVVSAKKKAALRPLRRAVAKRGVVASKRKAVHAKRASKLR